MSVYKAKCEPLSAFKSVGDLCILNHCCLVCKFYLVLHSHTCSQLLSTLIYFYMFRIAILSYTLVSVDNCHAKLHISICWELLSSLTCFYTFTLALSLCGFLRDSQLTSSLRCLRRFKIAVFSCTFLSTQNYCVPLYISIDSQLKSALIHFYAFTIAILTHLLP